MEEDIFSQNFLVFDMNQLRGKQANVNLITDDDLEFTREHFDKPIKHGVVTLDEKIFSIYTNSLLHTRSSFKQYEKSGSLLQQ